MKMNKFSLVIKELDLMIKVFDIAESTCHQDLESNDEFIKLKQKVLEMHLASSKNQEKWLKMMEKYKNKE